MRHFWKHWLVWLTVIAILLLIVNLPAQRVVATTVGTLRQWQGEWKGNSDSEPLPTTAGWPLQYSMRYDDLATATPFTSDSTLPLILNMLLGLGATTLLAGVTSLLSWNRSRSAAPQDSQRQYAKARRWLNPNIRLNIADLLVLTFLVAASFAIYQWLKRSAAADAALAQKLGADSSYVRETIVPSFIEDYLPSEIWNDSTKRLFLRTTKVRLNHPTDQQLHAALAIPRLRMISIGGGDYDLSLLAKLTEFQYLTSLTLTGKVLDNATLASIAKLDNLRELNLARTNLSHITLERLYEKRPEAAARLLRLRLPDTGVNLEALSESKVLPMMRSLRSLNLPRPQPGVEASLRLPALPNLRTLSVWSFDRGKNSAEVKLVIKQSPQLSKIDLGTLQKFSLGLHDLPLLTKIDSYAFQPALRVGANQTAPGSLWLGQCKVSEAPLLKKFDLYLGDLREIEFVGTPNLESVGPGVYQVAPQGYRGENRYDQQVSHAAVTAFNVGIGNSDGPNLIDFSAVPITGAELTPLIKNKRLKQLYLHHCELTSDDFQQLVNSETLEVVSSHGTQFEGAKLGKLVASLPNLNRWHADLFSVDRLRLENHDKVKGIVDCLPEGSNPRRCHLAQCSALRLIELPQWEDPIRLDAPEFRHLTIKNLPKLKQLFIDGQVCQDAVFQGLTGLSSIGMGGKAIDDSMIADWSDYLGLQTISLYGTSISATGLKKLLSDRKIHELDLRESQLDDEAFLSIDSSELRNLTLIHTGVTEESVKHALKSQALQKLVVDEIVLSGPVIDQILATDSLFSLGVQASGWQPKKLADLAKLPYLKELALRELSLDLAGTKALLKEKLPDLAQLTLIDSTLDEGAAVALVRRLPNTKFKLVRTDFPISLSASLLDTQRLVTEETQETFLYCRGPNGSPFPLLKQSQSGFMNAGWNFMQWSSRTDAGATFTPMPDEDYARLTPMLFFDGYENETIPFVEPNE